ncbi:MAG: hypothetical protein ACOZE5_03935 [Verrucomicrobiota bacterium]
MSARAEILRLRRRRNWYAAIAIAALLGSIGAALPRRLERYRAHQQANEEILRQQAALLDLQNRIRATQARIIRVQEELARETGQKP